MNYKIQEDREVVHSLEGSSVLNMVVYNIWFVKTEPAPEMLLTDAVCMQGVGLAKP